MTRQARIRQAVAVGITLALLSGACTDSGTKRREIPAGFLSTPWVLAHAQRAGRTLRLDVLGGCAAPGRSGLIRFDRLQVDEGKDDIFIAALSERVEVENLTCTGLPSRREVRYQLKAPLRSRKLVHAPISPEWPEELSRGIPPDASPDGSPPPRLATVPPYSTPTGPEPTTLPNGEPI